MSLRENSVLFGILSLVLIVSTAAAETKSAKEAAPTPIEVDLCLQDNRCTQLAESARDLSKAGQYEAALAAYKLAYSERPAPWLLVNIGRMEQKAGRPQLAVSTYKKFLDEPEASGELKEKVEKFLVQAEEEVVAKSPPVVVPPVSEPTAQQPAPRARRAPVYGIVTGSGSAWLLIGSAAILGIVGGRYNELQGSCAPACPGGQVDELRTLSNVGYGLLGVGAAAAIATGIVVYFELRGRREPATKLSALSTGIPLRAFGGF